jgi:hypothetical protein
MAGTVIGTIPGGGERLTEDASLVLAGRGTCGRIGDITSFAAAKSRVEELLTRRGLLEPGRDVSDDQLRSVASGEIQ